MADLICTDLTARFAECLAFDVFDKPARRFLNTICRDQLIQSAKLSTVPRVTTGVFQLAEVSHLIGESSLYDGPMEGVYLRLEDDFWLNQRAKIVCSEFTQQISEHWSQRCLVKNRRLHL